MVNLVIMNKEDEGIRVLHRIRREMTKVETTVHILREIQRNDYISPMI